MWQFRRSLTRPPLIKFARAGGRVGSFGRVGRWSGAVMGGQVLGLAVGVSARVPGSRVSGLSQCRGAAFSVSGLPELAYFFSTVSHCAWRRVISWSLATKKRSKENAFNHATLSVHSVQFPFIGAPKARCSPEPRMFEPLLLANPDIDTLRHQCSRASTIHPPTSKAPRVCAAAFLTTRSRPELNRTAYKFQIAF